MSEANAARARLPRLEAGRDDSGPKGPVDTFRQQLQRPQELIKVLIGAIAPFAHLEDKWVDVTQVQEALCPYLGSYTVADAVLTMNMLDARSEYDAEAYLYGGAAEGPYGVHTLLRALGEFVANAPAASLHCALARATFSMEDATYSHSKETLRQARYMCRQDLFAVANSEFSGGRFGDQRWVSPGPGMPNSEEQDTAA